jgi:hypothetical protein
MQQSEKEKQVKELEEFISKIDFVSIQNFFGDMGDCQIFCEKYALFKEAHENNSKIPYKGVYMPSFQEELKQEEMYKIQRKIEIQLEIFQDGAVNNAAAALQTHSADSTTVSEALSILNKIPCPATGSKVFEGNDQYTYLLENHQPTAEMTKTPGSLAQWLINKAKIEEKKSSNTSQESTKKEEKKKKKSEKSNKKRSAKNSPEKSKEHIEKSLEKEKNNRTMNFSSFFSRSNSSKKNLSSSAESLPTPTEAEGKNNLWSSTGNLPKSNDQQSASNISKSQSSKQKSQFKLNNTPTNTTATTTTTTTTVTTTTTATTPKT